MHEDGRGGEGKGTRGRGRSAEGRAGNCNEPSLSHKLPERQFSEFGQKLAWTKPGKENKMRHIHEAYDALLGSPPYGAVSFFFDRCSHVCLMFVLKILLQTLISALFFGNSVTQRSQNWEQRRDRAIIWRVVPDKPQMLGIILSSPNVGSLQQPFLHISHLQMPTTVMIEVVLSRNKRTDLFYCQFLGFLPGLH